MSHEDLIEAARAGQSHAGPFLVSLFGPPLLGYCRSITPDLNEVDREHIVANAIERAVLKIDKFDPARGAFEAWVRTFVLHASQDWRRDHQKMTSLDALREDGTAEIDRIASPPTIDQLEESTSRHLNPMIEALREAIPKLSLADQVILAMRDFDNRSVEEVAAILKISRDACRQRHSRAKVRLRKLLEDDARVSALLIGDRQ